MTEQPPRPVRVHLVQGEKDQYFIVEAEVNWVGEYARFQRIIQDGDDRALLQAIMEGLNGRVLGGKWEEVL